MPIKVIKSEIPQPLANYSEASQGRRFYFCRWPTRERLEGRRAEGGAQASEFSVLRLGYQAADRLYPEELGEDLQGRRHFPG